MSRSHSVGKDLVANTKTTMFTVPTRNMAKWLLLFATNHSAYYPAWWIDLRKNVTDVWCPYEYNTK